MCRNIHTLFNFEPPATEDEVRDASLQYVRKISGFTKPSQVNEEAFARAVEEVAAASKRLLDQLVTTAAPKNREVEAERARARAAKRFAAAHPTVPVTAVPALPADVRIPEGTHLVITLKERLIMTR